MKYGRCHCEFVLEYEKLQSDHPVIDFTIWGVIPQEQECRTEAMGHLIRTYWFQVSDSPRKDRDDGLCTWTFKNKASIAFSIVLSWQVLFNITVNIVYADLRKIYVSTALVWVWIAFPINEHKGDLLSQRIQQLSIRKRDFFFFLEGGD